MRHFRFGLIFLSFCLLAVRLCFAQNFNEMVKGKQGKTNADLLWETNPSVDSKMVFPIGLSDYLSLEDKNAKKVSIANGSWFFELNVRYQWDWGIHFWNAYPNDPRKLEWFKLAASRRRPLFLKNLNHLLVPSNNSTIDMLAYHQWKAEYDTMRAEYFASGIDEKERIKFLFIDYLNDINERLRYSDHRGGAKLDLDWVGEKIIEFAPYFAIDGLLGGDRRPYRGKNAVISSLLTMEANWRLYGLKLKEDLLPFFQSLSKISDKEISSYAKGRSLFYSLIGSPFNLKHTDIKDKPVNVKAMKEKLVYLDFWSTGCHSCIQMMPELKRIRDKYKSRGFEVVSICINPEKDKEQVLKIYNKVGAGWPLLLIGGKGKSNSLGGLAKEIWNRYQFSGVPKLFLLDENRNVIGYQVHGTELEKILEERLGSK